jgi:hypothetical protein
MFTDISEDRSAATFRREASQRFCKVSVNTYQTTQRHIPECCILHSHAERTSHLTRLLYFQEVYFYNCVYFRTPIVLTWNWSYIFENSRPIQATVTSHQLRNTDTDNDPPAPHMRDGEGPHLSKDSSGQLSGILNVRYRALFHRTQTAWGPERAVFWLGKKGTEILLCISPRLTLTSGDIR